MYVQFLSDFLQFHAAWYSNSAGLRLHLVKRRVTMLSYAKEFRTGMLKGMRRLWKQIVGFEDPQVEEEVFKQVLQVHLRYPPVLVISTLGSLVAFQWSIISDRVMVIPKPLCWTILLIHTLGLLLTIFRDQLINRNTVHLWYCCGALICTATLLPGFVPENHRLLWSMTTFCFYRLPATAMTTRLSLILASNLCYTVVTLLVMVLDTENREYDNGGDRVYVAFWLEALLLTLAVVAAFSQRLSMKILVKKRISQANMESRQWRKPWKRHQQILHSKPFQQAPAALETLKPCITECHNVIYITYIHVLDNMH